MEIKVKMYATFRKYAPIGTELGKAFNLNIRGNTINDIIDTLGIDEKTQLIVMVNGNRTTDFSQNVNENDLVVFFPQLGGG